MIALAVRLLLRRISNTMHLQRILLELRFKLCVVDGEHEGLREKIVFLRIALIHFHETTRQLLFVCHDSDAGEL